MWSSDRKLRFYVSLFAAFMLFPGIAFPQEEKATPWSIEANLFVGEIQKPYPVVAGILDNGFHWIYNFKFGFHTLQRPDSLFAADYNFPTLGIGISSAYFHNVKMNDASYLANVYSLHGFMDRPLFRSNRFQLKYTLEAGFAFAPEPYNIITNPDNYFVSYPVMVYVGFGAGVNYRFWDKMELTADVGVKHYSNGRMGMPNKGINIVGTNLGMRYLFSLPREQLQETKKIPFKPHFYGHAYVSGGVQKSTEEWEIYLMDKDPEKTQRSFKYYPKASLSADIMYRFSRKYGTGIGLDVFSTPNIKKHREWDEVLYGKEATEGVAYNQMSLGISINQEVYYRNLALYASFGYYVFRELGIRADESAYYQRAGFRLYFPGLEDMFLGYGIKAHNFRLAEFLELSVGKRF